MNKSYGKVTDLGLRDEYCCWRNIIDRCERTTHPEYHRYGGRGIVMNQVWRNNFYEFFSDMGRRPGAMTRKDEWSIDRIDNNLGYTKENCRWVQRHTQMDNREVVLMHTIDGVTRSISEWARLTGEAYSTIYSRATRDKVKEQRKARKLAKKLEKNKDK